MQRSTRIFLSTLALTLTLTLASCGGGGGSAPVAAPAAPVGNAIAGTTTTGDTAGTPARPVEPAAVSLKLVELATGLDSPWGLAFLPDARMLITQRGGQLRLRKADGTPDATNDLITGVPPVLVAGQGGLLDVAVDPNFAANRRIYMSFSEGTTTLNGTAVMRAELNLSTRALENVTVIFQQLPKVNSTAHFGSRLAFDRNGYLFVTLGERLNDDQRGFAQDLTRGNGKVMRITTDGAAAPGNPFASTAGGQPTIFSYGHRNPQGAAIHPTTGDLWVSEHGPQGGDEINRVVAGHNYGWPVISYGQEYGTTTQVGEGTAKAGMDQPVTYWEKIDGSAWTPGTQKSSIAPSGWPSTTRMRFHSGRAICLWALWLARRCGASRSMATWWRRVSGCWQTAANVSAMCGKDLTAGSTC